MTLSRPDEKLIDELSTLDESVLEAEYSARNDRLDRRSFDDNGKEVRLPPIPLEQKTRLWSVMIRISFEMKQRGMIKQEVFDARVEQQRDDLALKVPVSV